jgi:hypothetical protein
MRWRVAALIALFGMAAVPVASGAAQSGHVSVLSVSVKPGAGTARTHFVVSFRAALTTGPRAHKSYRITAGGPAHAGCQSSAVANAPATKAGSIVRVVLAPSGSAGWCGGTFRGEVLQVIAFPCPVGKACPAIIVPPLMVGRFTFHVTRG